MHSCSHLASFLDKIYVQAEREPGADLALGAREPCPFAGGHQSCHIIPYSLRLLWVLPCPLKL